MDELLPIFEREGVQLILEPHPDDFIEDGLEAVNMIRGLNKDWIGFLYCTPHAFHQGHDAGDHHRGRRGEDPLRAPGRCLGPHHVQRLCATSPTRPATPSRVHQHMEMGMGEVDYDAVFAALAAADFDGVISSCVFGWEEDARGVSERQRDKAIALVDQALRNRCRSRPDIQHHNLINAYEKEDTMATTLHHWKNGAPFDGTGRSVLRRHQPGDRRGHRPAARWPARPMSTRSSRPPPRPSRSGGTPHWPSGRRSCSRSGSC